MFNLAVNREQEQYVDELLKHANFGRRGDFDGNHDQQRTGILAQTVVADMLHQPRPVDNHKSDGGVDFELCGRTIDLKTMGRNVSVQNHFVHNFNGHQISFDTDILLFASLNKRTQVLTICGWLTKEEFKVLAEFFPQGTERFRDNGTSFKVRGSAGNYEIQQSKLHKIDSLHQFRSEIKTLGGDNCGRSNSYSNQRSTGNY